MVEGRGDGQGLGGEAPPLGEVAESARAHAATERPYTAGGITIPNFPAPEGEWC